MDDETGDRDGLFVRQVPVHLAVEIADRDAAVDIDGAVRLRADRDVANVVLVGDLADDLLQNVLERDQALDLTVLVDDERELNLAALEGAELVVDAGGVGHEPRLGRQRAHVELVDCPAVPAERRQQGPWSGARR